MINHCILFVTLSLLMTPIAVAHDDGDFAAWFRSLHNESGVSCCSPSRDCKETDSYVGTDNGYKVMYNGAEINVPWNVVLQRSDNPTGHAVICVSLIAGQPFARCFIRASEG